jgi:hypothetical protein
MKQATDEFIEAGARLAEALRQVTAVSFTASGAAAIVVKAVSEIVEATKVINGDLESYVRLVVSGSTPIRRQPMPVTLVETLAPTPTTLPILPPFPKCRPCRYSEVQRLEFLLMVGAVSRGGASQ